MLINEAKFTQVNLEINFLGRTNTKAFLTLPDLWSGTIKLKIVLSPGAGSSTVTVVRSYKFK